MPISPLPWKAVQAANISSECWVIEDADGKAVAVAQDVMLDMHLGWTKMSRENVEFIVESVNMLQGIKKALADWSASYPDKAGKPTPPPVRMIKDDKRDNLDDE